MTDDDRKIAVASLRVTRRIVAQPALARHGSTPVSFVSDFRYLDGSFDDLRLVMDDPTSAWLADLAELDAPTPPDAWAPAVAGSTGRRAAATVRVGIGPRLARIFVLVSVGAGAVWRGLSSICICGGR